MYRPENGERPQRQRAEAYTFAGSALRNLHGSARRLKILRKVLWRFARPHTSR